MMTLEKAIYVTVTVTARVIESARIVCASILKLVSFPLSMCSNIPIICAVIHSFLL